MHRPNEDWKGWFPDEFHIVSKVHSSNLISDVRSIVEDSLKRDGRFNRHKQIKVAEALEGLAKNIRAKNLNLDKIQG